MTDLASTERERAPVFEFDYVRDPDVLADAHKGYWKLKEQAPSLFWTHCNGGHWVTTKADVITKILRHPEIFSSKFLSIPPNAMQPKMIPESLDPPEHRPYRQMLRPFFEGKAIAPLEPRITEWTTDLIDRVAESGECNFVEAVASRLPVSVFMEIFGFPMERFFEFRSISNQYFDHATDEQKRNELTGTILQMLTELIQARMAEPKEDLISTLATIDFAGRKLTFEELMSIGFLMFLAGLDTVTNAMTWGMRHLANDAALRQRIIDDPDCIPNAVEELLRRYAFVSPPRYLVQDTLIDGVELKAGESIFLPLMMVGWDEKLAANPDKVDVDRAHFRHAAFGSGVHTCLGLHLARMELAIFYRLWFEKIGHFTEDTSKPGPRMRGGSIIACENLHLKWG